MTDAFAARRAAYAEAGADALSVPGIATPAGIAAVVRAAAPRPANPLVPRPIGLSLAGIAWGALSRAWDRPERGDLAALGERLPGASLDGFFKN